MHSIESSIAAEVKITQLTRRLELLDAREQNSVNQTNPPQMTNLSCTYYHALTHIFEECPVYLAQQMLPDGMNRAFTRPNFNPYSKTYNPGWRNHPNFTWSQSGLEEPRQHFSHQFAAQTHQPNFQPTYQFFNPLTNSNKIIQIKI